MEERLLAKLPKALRIKEEIKESILSGNYGNRGDAFVSTRRLARDAGVSLVTAHRVVNMLKDDNLIKLIGNKFYLSFNKKEHKRKSANTEKYKTKNTIGLIVTNLENPFFAALAEKVEACARHKGYKLIIASNNYDFIRENEIMDMLRRVGVCGIISCPGTAPDTYKLYSSMEPPVVFIGRKLERLDVDAVLVHHSLAVRKIVRHFVETGYKNFAYIGIKEFGDDPRLQSYIAELHASGFNLNGGNIIKSDVKNLDSVLPDISRLLKKTSKPLAISCFHDLLALRAIRACHELNLKIPADVAIAGFDNLPVAAEIIPPLTTISYSIKEMAEIACERIIKRIKVENLKAVTSFVEPELIVRESTSAHVKTSNINAISEDCLCYQFSTKEETCQLPRQP